MKYNSCKGQYAFMGTVIHNQQLNSSHNSQKNRWLLSPQSRQHPIRISVEHVLHMHWYSSTVLTWTSVGYNMQCFFLVLSGLRPLWSVADSNSVIFPILGPLSFWGLQVLFSEGGVRGARVTVPDTLLERTPPPVLCHSEGGKGDVQSPITGFKTPL